MTLIGRRLGVYQIESLLGAGGMGEVYRARDTRLGRDVAIKTLPEALIADRDRLARFEREARLLASLNHPNIAHIYGLEGDPPVIVMEFVDGATLADRISSTSGLPVAEALTIARQLVDALDAAHERGIVHRDLKPANIKIAPDGIVKVLDFGLAKADSDTTASDLSHSPTITADHTKDGVILGTAAYMSPEQARGRPVDKRSDIWAFGCVVFELLTGRRAFPGETVSDIIGAILHSEPQLTALPPDVPPRVRELLRRCFQKDARQRLRDIGDARYELDTPLDLSVRPSPADVAPARALPWVFAVLSLLVAVAAVGWSRRPPPAGTSLAPQLSPAIRITNTTGAEFGPAISPDGKWVAYYANANARTDLIVKFLDSGSTLNLTGSFNMELPTRAGQGGLAISPDGALIAFAARPDPTLAQYDTWVIPAPAGGAPRKLLGSIGSVQWSPDGKLFTYTMAGSQAGDGLGVSSSDGTSPRTVVPREGGRHIHWPAWSRDGKYIYFIYTYDGWHTEPAETWRVLVSGGKPEPVVRTVRRAIYPVPLPSGALLFSGNPTSLDLGLWWQRNPGDEPIALTNGLGEHIESRISADGKRIVSTLLDVRQSLLSIAVAGEKPELVPLTDGHSGDLFPSVDLRTGRIVFSSSRSGHRNLWVTDADGGHPSPLTSESAIDENPSVSPDGQQIAFVSDRGNQRAIWLMSSLGGAPRLLAHETVLDTLTWSHDSQRLYFAKPGGDFPSLASVNVSDGRVETIGPPGRTAPAASPTADVLAYLDVLMEPAPPPATGTVSRLYVKFVDSQGAPLYPNLPRQVFVNPMTAWSPDGMSLAVISMPANGPAQIWIAQPQAAQPFRKLIDLPNDTRPRGLTWSKDAKNVIIANQQYSGDIVMYDVR